jgi:orotidine-5'-phosphate decarboxylase
MAFREKFNAVVDQNKSFVCVGLDPDPEQIPEHLKGSSDPITAFLTEIVAATKDIVCTYKPNFAFFGAHGIAGWQALQNTIKSIPDHIPILLDFKAGDIGNTATQYARMAYDQLGADAITVNPLMGTDAIEPFLAYQEGCAFLLCLTSNPGSADVFRLNTDQGILFEVLAKKSVTWNQAGPCGLVVGATHPDDLLRIRNIATDLPILLPGVGAQGADTNAIVQNGLDANGGGILVNASRSILYASNGKDFAEAARQSAENLRKMLNNARTKP